MANGPESSSNHARSEFIEQILAKDRGELTELQRDVVDALKKQSILTQDVNSAFDQQLTLGERISDAIADWGGSWSFILSFLFFLFAWMLYNAAQDQAGFDPYPFVFLNLILSCLAALQAPVIMMSQRRTEEKDRLRAEYDFRVNLKAELEIQHLNLKIDQLMTKQWEHLLEIQRIQLETLEQLRDTK